VARGAARLRRRRERHPELHVYCRGRARRSNATARVARRRLTAGAFPVMSASLYSGSVAAIPHPVHQRPVVTGAPSQCHHAYKPRNTFQYTIFRAISCCCGTPAHVLRGNRDSTSSTNYFTRFRVRARARAETSLRLLEADCTLKATRSYTTCRVALPGAHPTQRHARPRAAGRHSPKRLSGLSGGA